MAEFEGIPLLGKPGSAGAWFRLGKPPTHDARIHLGGDLEVEVRKGLRAVVVRGAFGSSHPEVFASAPEAANRALDLLSLKLRPALVVADLHDLHVTWWPESDGASVVRFFFSHTMTFSANISVTVTPPDGQSIPDANAPPSWQESMRYFRMSEVTDDLFDSFRNTYLAIESILSEIEPMKPGRSSHGWEAEQDWFKRALRTANGHVQVSRYAPSPDGGDPIHAIWLELCEQLRHAVFHAKTARNPLLPQDGFSRSRILEARQRYARLYLALVGTILGASLGRGETGIGPALQRAVAQAQADEMCIAIADDPTPAVDVDELMSPANGVVQTLETEFDLVHNRLTLEAEVQVADLLPGVAVGRFGAVQKDTGQALVFDGLAGRLGLTGFDRCQVSLSLGTIGDPGLKSDFGS
jgi:hypothetical protein